MVQSKHATCSCLTASMWHDAEQVQDATCSCLTLCIMMQSKFKHAACSVVGQADARSFAVGAERVSYEGPLRVRLPVKKKLDPNGDFSFEVPLPNPDRQVLVKRFAGGLKGALKSPLTAQRTQTAPTAQTTSGLAQCLLTLVCAVSAVARHAADTHIDCVCIDYSRSVLCARTGMLSFGMLL